jgi:hypothetical protein
MISSEDFEVVGAYMRFLDDPKDKAPVAVNIGIIDSEEKAEALSNGILSDNPYWYHFDSNIFAYVNTYLGETIEQYYSEETTLNDFILIREEEVD